MTQAVATTPISAPDKRRWAALAGVLLAALGWSYWSTLSELIAFWRINEDYSVGQLAPLVGAYLFYRERKRLDPVLRPSVWGLLAVLAAQGLRFGALLYDSAFVERFSLLATFSGLLLLVAGPRIWRQLFWQQAFLLLMLPLPSTLHDRVALPLQNWATSMGHFGLELCGFLVRREGNVLQIGANTTVGVDEACSGLRMLTAFIFTAAVLVFLVQRPAWQRVIVMLSAVPIAVLSNGVRVLATSIFYHYVKNPQWQQQFHDWAGVMMMPLAVLVIVGELRLLKIIATPTAAPTSAAQT